MKQKHFDNKHQGISDLNFDIWEDLAISPNNALSQVITFQHEGNCNGPLCAVVILSDESFFFLSGEGEKNCEKEKGDFCRERADKGFTQFWSRKASKKRMITMKIPIL